MMKRIIDILLSLFLLALFFIPMSIIALCVRFNSCGPSLFWSDRVGRNNIIFKMPKFRTMHIDSPNVATHLLKDPTKHLTSIGGLLRNSSMDELPQLISVFKGDLSFVGPRPALYNQEDLIQLRKIRGIDRLKPGITGWAQVNGRDELSIEEKVHLDAEYMNDRSFTFDCKILWMTGIRVFLGRGIAH